MKNITALVQQNIDLTLLNTLRVPALTAYFAKVQSKEQLQKVVVEKKFEYPVFILGGGSNILFVDDFEGLVIQPDIKGKKVIREDQEHVWLNVGAGEIWHELVRFCVEKGWGGVENLSLIPGRAGAAPIQNIGAYGVEFEDVFISLNATEITTGTEKLFTKEDCELGYRESVFKGRLKNKYIITDVTIRLDKAPRVNASYGAIQQKLKERSIKDPSIAEISDIVIDIRNSKLPNPDTVPNAGSFFKNPIIKNSAFEALRKEFSGMPHYSVNKNHTKIPAGWLIEKTGWKGREKGNVGIYEQQALVVVNKGGATGEEILSLANEVQRSVAQMFGIELVPEVNVVG